MRTKRAFQKTVSWILTVAMLLSMMPGMAFATATESDPVYSVSEDTEPTPALLYAVAKIGETGYETLTEALTAAADMSDEVVVEIYDKVTLSSSLSGSYGSIKFVGKDTDAEIYLDVQGYITAAGKTVAFEDLTLSKSEGGFITNAGFMNVAFGVYDVAEVTYTNCTFANGAYASSGKVTFTGCTFYRSHDKYGLWAYGNVDCTVDDCTFADYRGIKMYAEDAAKTADLTVKDTDFSAVTGKPAIVLTYGESVTLEDNTYSSTGVFELDLDGEPNGTEVTSDEAPTCVNDNGACGVLVDGKIYTTVAQAAAVATSGSAVTLLHDSTETVEFAEGVTLDKNGFAADGVTVAVSAPTANTYQVATKAELDSALAAAQEGEIILLTADIDYGTDQLKIEKAITLNLGGKTLTTRNAFGGMSIKNNPTVKNGTIVHASNTAAIKVWNATAFEDLVIDVQGKGDANKTIGGIVLQSGSTTRVGSIKDVTIKGDALTNGIETYNCGDAAENVIDSMENVNIDANGIAMLISAPVGTATGCTFDGGVNGIELWIKSNYSASLTLVDCDVVGDVFVHDEFNSADITNAGTLTLTVDDATIGVTAETVTLTINHAEESQVQGEVLKTVIKKAVAKANGTYYTDLQAAIDAIETSGTVTVLADIELEETVTIPEDKTVTLDMNGKKLTVTDKKESGNYELFYIYGGMTVTGNGTIELTAIHDRDWSAMSAIFHNRGGVLTIENGTFTHMGGSDMAYVVDNSGNYFGDATTNIKDGTLTSSYIAIRNRMEQNSHGASGEAILNISGGTISGTRRAVWAQAASANVAYPATGEINVSGGTIGLIETACSTGAVSMTTVSGGTVAEFKGEVGELTVTGGTVSKVTMLTASGETTDYEVNDDGVYVATSYVAKVGDVKYEDIQEAIKNAAPAGTVELLSDVTVDVWKMFWQGDKTFTDIIYIDMNGLTIDGKNHVLTVKDIVSSTNGDTLFKGAACLNIKDLTINYIDDAASKGGISLESGTISNVTVIGGIGVYPGEGAVTITGCTFNTTGSAIYNEEPLDKLVVTGNTFNVANDGYAIYIRGGTTFTGNTVTAGKVNVTSSATGTISGNNFNDNRFKVYNDATATISNNTINYLVFNDKTPTTATFTDNTLSTGAQAALDAVTAETTGLSGSGTETAPYLIKSVEDLILFRDSVNNGETTYNAVGVYVALAADIDMNGAKWERGIGDGINATYDGIFDGKNFTIKNLKLAPKADSDGYLCGGLFGYTYGAAVIKNLVLENITVTAEDAGHNVGALVGFAYNKGGKLTVSNVAVKNVTIDAPNTYGVGAIVGYSYCSMGTIEDCSVESAVIKGYSFVGGIIGYSYSDAVITECSVTDATITATSKGAGGIAGLALDGNKITKNTVSQTTITASTNWGYVVGEVASEGIVVADNTAAEPQVGGNYSTGEAVQAKIGDKYYTTLTAALSAAQAGDTIVLLAPVTVAAGETLTINKDVTITYTSNVPGEDMITNKGIVTISAGKLTYVNTDTTATNVTVSTISCEPGSVLNITGGTVENTSVKADSSSIYPYAIDLLTNGTLGDVTANISGGTVSSDYMAIRQFNNGDACKNTLNISGGNIYGAKRAVQIHFKNNAAYTTIIGGEIKGGDYALCFLTTSENLTVSGGKFTGSVWYSGEDGFISGGTFSEAVEAEYCAEGYIPTENSDGTFGVVEAPTGLSGSGTEADPYLIKSVEDLIWLRDKVDEQAADGSTQFAGKYFKLTGDIDLAGIKWNPIGSMSGDHGSFKGVFDGDNHTISNLNVEQAGNGLGLFARTAGNAEIKNLKLNNVTVKSTDNSNYVGGVVGNSYASTKITNVHVTGNINISGRGYIGGISGHGYVVMDNVSVVGTGTVSSTFWCAGGILGYGGEGATNINNAHVEGITVTSAAGGLGAIVGMAEDNNGTQPISGSNLSAKNVEIKTYTGAYGDAYANYALGYLYGGNPTSKLTGELTVENVTIQTSSGETPEVNDAVATVGDKIYFDLHSAINAGGDIKLLRDVTVDDTVKIPAGKTVTLDLNGKVISQSKACTASYSMIENAGKLTINDSVGDGKISFTDTGAGDPNFGWGSYTVTNRGTLVVNGGTIEHLGEQNTLGNVVHMYCAIQQAAGSTTINGGTISTPTYRSVRINGGELVINGGTFEGQVWLQPNQSDVTMEITGGTFAPCGGDGSSVFMTNVGENKTISRAVISGGTFTTRIGASNATALAGSITGGTFSASAKENTNAALIAKGMMFGEADAQGNYTLVVDPTVLYIDTLDELKAFRNAVNSEDTFSGKTVYLDANIDLNGEAWTPIGTKENPFKGTFDGQNYTISNLVVSGTINQGFFGYADTATIKNLKIENATVTGTDCVGGIAGQVYSSSKIENCHVSGSIEIEGQTNVGGIVGKYYTKVADCSVIGDGVDTSYVKGTYVASDYEGDNVGGIMGHCGENNSLTGNTVKNITVSGTRKVGGIVGVADQNTDVTGCVVENVVIKTTATADYAASKVTSMSIGGLIGQYQAAGSSPDGTVIDNTVNGVKFVIPDDVTCSAGAIVGGARGGTDGMLAPSTNVSAENNEITNVTGATNSYLMNVVAQIGDTYYETLAAALSAAQADDTITLLDDVELTESITIAGKTLTLNLGTYTIFDKSETVLTTNDNIWGLIELKNGADLTISGDGKIQCNYAAATDGWTGMAYAINVDSTSKLTVNGGTFINGNGGIQTLGTVIVNGGTFISHNGGTCIMAVHSKAEVTVKDGTFKDSVEESDIYTGSGAVWSGFGATVKIEGGTYDFAADTSNDNVMWTLFPAQHAIAGQSYEVKMTVTGGTFANFNPAKNVIVDYSSAAGFTFGSVVADGYAALPDLNGNYVVGVKPTATVKNLGAVTVPAGEYGVWNGSSYSSSGETDMPLSFVMQFLADQGEEDMATSPYADWYGDFVITFTGIEDGSFTADGCYLAGHYGSFGWVKVPVDGMNIQEDDRYPVMLGVGLGQKYDYICSSVEDFKCAMYLSPEILAANPNLEVNLELAVVDNSEGSDAAAEALVKGESVYSVVDYTYTAEDFVITYAAQIGETKYKTLAEAVEAAQDGDTITVIADIADEAVSVDKNVTITGSVTANNVSINAVEGCTELTVSGLTFTGNSWINSGAADKLTVSGVTANVTPSNGTYTNSRSAFISLGRSEGKTLKLVVENSSIVAAGGADPILGWASITEATITGNTFGSAEAYQTSGDSVKFMAIADGAVFNVKSNTVYSNYNGIVFGQNTTRDNAYTVNLSGNIFMGSADHIWLEVTGSTTCNATVIADTTNTVNGNAFTAADIKLQSNLNTFTGYLGVGVETDAAGKLIGGTYTVEPAAELIAEGYKAVENSTNTYDIELEELTDENLVFFTQALNIGAYIGAEFVVDPNGEAGYDRVYVVFERENGDITTVESYTETPAGNTIYKSFILQTFAAEMGDKVSVTLYGVKDEKTYKGQNIKDWSVALKLYEMLEARTTKSDMTNADKNMCALVLAMLDYGAEAQLAFGHSTDALVNADAEQYDEYATATVPELADTSSVTGYGYTGATLKVRALGLEEVVQLQTVFEFPDTNFEKYEARITLGSGKNLIISGADFDDPGYKTWGTVIFDQFVAYEMGTKIGVTIYCGDTPISETHTLSILDVAAGMVGGKFDSLVKAMATYGNAAEKVFVN